MARTFESCASCAIHAQAICALCDADEMHVLDEMKYFRSYPPGQTIVFAGDRLDFMASVVSGLATLSQDLHDGRRQTVGLLQPSDFIGRPGRPIARYDITAASEVLLCCFARRPFEKLIARTAHIGSRLLEMTLDELDAARDWMLVLGRKSAREKIASLLLILATRAAQNAGPPFSADVQIDLPLTREAMADHLGLTLETVSRQFSALRHDGVITLAGARHITIADMARLRREAGDGLHI
ncbi:transcriptional regulator FnrL [Ketogulonicigenium vulgare]|uniref:transcriptional regulator FnrL n=1 Tax=Ketogulonicigenium vulgare TaxID=92945 RepID=UPI00235999CC|nr:helix-turn-helix domain-containing protein [Ketogulonicigenium vulgare]